MGNKDGYSVGYHDGQKGDAPDPDRFMTPEDYALSSELGGRVTRE